MKHLITAAALLTSTMSYGATVAIIDSGTDMQHEVIAPQAWINPIEIPGNDRDEDRNGYQDDIYGWNFAEGNNQVIDYSYLGLLTEDVKKFFAIQTKFFYGTASSEEITWMREQVKDEAFIKRLSTYGNFMHGTHVAGIAAKKNDAKILAIKLIPTEVKLPGQNLTEEGKGNSLKLKILRGLLTTLAKQQVKLMEEIGAYVNFHKAEIANGSFGTGFNQAKMIVETVGKVVVKDITPEQIEEMAHHFMNTLLLEGQKFVSAAPKTLFVFAAGNDAMDNDKYPTFPTNIAAPNVISVAATLEDLTIAPFSNYGAKEVDVAAPGVGITSAAPGNNYIQVSGTSQAAPYVANIAAKVVEANSNLNPAQVREIIIKTVDKRDFLKGKVSAEGIVNSERAIRAAELSLEHSLEMSVEISHLEIIDSGNNKAFGPKSVAHKGFVLPLPSNFVIR
ncbi:MAG: hypothetical protein Fur0010_08530 [Bdellovibrio sp.]